MSDEAQMRERHGAVLAELSELGLALARDLQARALAAEDGKAAADLASAFHKVARGVRQSLALEARLHRDCERAAREAQAEAERRQAAAVVRRKAQVRAAVERLIWTEAEEDEMVGLLEDLEERLGEEALHEDFGQEPLEAQVARLCGELGLAPPQAAPSAAALGAPDPPDPGSANSDWRSSG